MNGVRVRLGEIGFLGARKDLVLRDGQLQVLSLTGAVEQRYTLSELSEIRFCRGTAHVNHRYRTEISLARPTGVVFVCGGFDQQTAAFYNVVARALAAAGHLDKSWSGRAFGPVDGMKAVVHLGILFCYTVILLMSQLWIVAAVVGVIFGFVARQALRHRAAPRCFADLEAALAANPEKKTVVTFG